MSSGVRSDWYKARLLAPPVIALVVAVSLAVFTGTALAQLGPFWERVEEDARYSGSHAQVAIPATRDSEAGLLQVGCNARDGLPTVVLEADRQLGVGEREIYLRVVGMQDATMHRVMTDGTSLMTDGFNAVTFLAEVLAFPSARALFLQLEGEDDIAWSVSLRGVRDALTGMSCLEALGY